MSTKKVLLRNYPYKKSSLFYVFTSFGYIRTDNTLDDPRKRALTRTLVEIYTTRFSSKSIVSTLSNLVECLKSENIKKRELVDSKTESRSILLPAVATKSLTPYPQSLGLSIEKSQLGLVSIGVCMLPSVATKHMLPPTPNKGLYTLLPAVATPLINTNINSSHPDIGNEELVSPSGSSILMSYLPTFKKTTYYKVVLKEDFFFLKPVVFSFGSSLLGIIGRITHTNFGDDAPAVHSKSSVYNLRLGHGEGIT